jgi:sucrose-6-phosphate hydrolase SacC (GH32 family)
MCECPNLFELPVDGKPNDRRWVIWGSDTAYRIGRFDGKAFVPATPERYRTHHGQLSASQVFANAPGGRVIQIGWAHCCDYAGEFSQMASFPLELSLRTTAQGVRLFAVFVPELAALRAAGSVQKDLVVQADAPLGTGDVSQPMEILAEFEPGKASRVCLTGAELAITWNAEAQELEVHGQLAATHQKVKLSPVDGQVRLHVLLDIPSVEVVGNDGEAYLIKGRDYRKLVPRSPLAIRAEGGDVTFRRLEIYPLRSIHGGAAD